DGNSFVQVSNSSSLDIRRTITLETWLEVDTFANSWMPVIQKATGSGPDTRTYSLWVNSAGFLHFTSSDGPGAEDTGEQFVDTPAGSIRPGDWHHFAGVVDRNTGRMDAYLDGELVASGSVSKTDTISTTGPLLFGKTLEVSADLSSFKGTLDEVRVWE